MATLTETASILRKTILFGGIGIVIIIIASIFVLPTINQPVAPVILPTPTPDASFGPLPALQFPPSKSRPTSYKLETIEGGPPVSTSSAYVYFVPQKAPNLFSRKNAVTFAQKFGFGETYEDLGNNTFRFIDPDTQETLTVTITNNNFTYKNNYIDPAILENVSTIPNEATIVSKAQGYFQGNNTWNPDLTKHTITYLEFQGSSLVQASKPSSAQVVRVDFYPDSMGGYPLKTATIDTSPVYVIFALNDSKIQQILESSYQYYPPDETTASLYPTISGEDAWQLLTKGEGYIAKQINSGTQAVVREGYLAYLLPEVFSYYLQPIYVFEGDNGFVGMVPAIKSAQVE